jgi:hypothetical protein
MIRIFNNKLKKEILLDETNGVVRLHPRQYDDDNPHVQIEIKGVNLGHHAYSCSDCDAFVKALGSQSHDWYLDINGTIHRLNLFGLGNEPHENQFRTTISYYFTGTKLKLNIDTDTVESLTAELQNHIAAENYEQCCYFRDKIEDIKSNIGSH